jgi:hypothetical protein
MARASWMLSSSLLLAACAHGTGAERSKGDRDAAQRIYMVAEERYAAGDYTKAVALMRHALLQLPATSDHDELRHKLVLRMAHTQLRDHAATGDAAPLHDAQQMLERYAHKHEELFGESKKARRERGDVYELLHLVEQQLEPVNVDYGDSAIAEAFAAAPEGSAPTDATAIAEAPQASEVVAVPEVPEQIAAATSVEPEPAVDEAPTPTRVARHVDADGDEVRDVVVARQRPSIDDPETRKKLASPFSTGWLGGVLTAYGITKVRDARPLVRGFSRLTGDGALSQQLLARRAGQSLLHEARQDLRSCYADAYARRPIAALESEIEASVHPDGSISHVRIVEGGLVDGYGDACLIEALQDTLVAPLEQSAEPVRVQVALTFFYERALYIVEGTGEMFHEGDLVQSPPPPLQGLPAIDRFVPLQKEVPRARRRGY